LANAKYRDKTIAKKLETLGKEEIVNLNIGSGENAVEGYINLDYSPNVLLSRAPLLKSVMKWLKILKPEHMKSWDKSIVYKDARKLNYAETSVDLIYSSHFLEHIYYWEAQELLKSCYKFLAPGGTLRLALPDYKLMAEGFIEQHKTDPLAASWDFNRSLLSYPFHKAEMVMFFLNSRFGHVHKWHPTPAMAEELLINAGFKQVASFDFQKGPYPELEAIEHRSEGTFYIQASK
jgi:predicted SAM-dependent methyltransferase